MALLLYEGWDHIQTADLNYKGWTAVGTTAPVIDTTAGRDGKGALKLGSVNTNQTRSAVSHALGANLTTVYFGFAIKVLGDGGGDLPTGFVWFREGSTLHGNLAREANGMISLQRAGTTIATFNPDVIIPPGQWCHISGFIVIGNATGGGQITVDGVTSNLISNVDTQNGGTGVVNDILLQNADDANGAGYLFDDLWVDSTTNHGNCHVHTSWPSGTGALAQFTSSTGGANYTTVDEALLSAADYNKSSTNGQIDTFPHTGIPATAAVKALKVTTIGLTTGNDMVRPTVRVGGANYDKGVDLALAGSLAEKSSIFETNPATAAPWTAAEVNAAEIGYKKSA